MKQAISCVIVIILTSVLLKTIHICLLEMEKGGENMIGDTELHPVLGHQHSLDVT